MTVNGSVNAANLMMVGMQASNSSTDLSGTSSKDFASALTDASNKASSYEPKQSASQVQHVDEKKTEMDSSDFGDSDIKNSGESTKTDKSSDVEVSKNDKEDSIEANTISDDNSEENIAFSVLENSDGQLDPDTMQDILDVLSTLIQEISRILDIPVENVVEKLEAMDMGTEGLLDTDEMMNVLLNVKDATPMDLLTDEDLSNQFQMLQDVIRQAKEQLETMQVELEDVVAGFTLDDVLVEDADMVLADSSYTGLNPSESKMDDEPKTNGTSEPVVMVEDNRINKPVELMNETKQDSSNDSNLWKENDFRNVKENTKEVHFENPILQNIQTNVEELDISMIGEAKNVTPAQVIDQIVEQVKVSMNQDSTSLEMQLYPEHLGKIQINVVSKEGVMTAHIVAESEAAKQAIEGGLANLRDAMEQQNIKVEAIEVMVSTTGFEQRDENQGSTQENGKSKSNRKIDLSELDEEQLDEEDVAEVEKMKANGSSVSYSV